MLLSALLPHPRSGRDGFQAPAFASRARQEFTRVMADLRCPHSFELDGRPLAVFLNRQTQVLHLGVFVYPMT